MDTTDGQIDLSKREQGDLTRENSLGTVKTFLIEEMIALRAGKAVPAESQTLCNLAAKFTNIYKVEVDGIKAYALAKSAGVTNITKNEIPTMHKPVLSIGGGALPNNTEAAVPEIKQDHESCYKGKQTIFEFVTEDERNELSNSLMEASMFSHYKSFMFVPNKEQTFTIETEDETVKNFIRYTNEKEDLQIREHN